MVAGLSFISYFHHRIESATGIFVFLMGIVSMIWFKLTQKKTAAEVLEVIMKTEWKAVVFLMGTFVVAAAVRESGIMSDLVLLVGNIAGDIKGYAFIILIAVSVLVSAFVDNVVYVAVLLPFASIYALAIDADPELFTFAILLGSCIGSCITPVGSSANIIAVDMLKDNGEDFSFGEWTKTGIPFAAITAAVSGLFLWGVWN